MSLRSFFTTFIFLLVFICQSFSQIENGDFELWEDSLEVVHNAEGLVDSASQAVPLTWTNLKENQNPSHIGFLRTTDAAYGQYATVIFTWYVYVKVHLAKKDSIDIRPDFIAGYYKYIPNHTIPADVDSAVVSVLVYDGLGDTIGTSLNYLDTTSTYTSFKFPIEYINNNEGAYYEIVFTSSTSYCPGLTNQCNFLYLDGITFDYFTSSEEVKESTVQIFPNPFGERINFSENVTTCTVYNLQGQLVKSAKNVNSFNIEGAPGMYIIRVEDEKGLISTHKVIKSQ